MKSKNSDIRRTELAFRVYLVFIVSWFLHLGSRIPILGALRIDLLLVLFLLTASSSRARTTTHPGDVTSRILKFLMIYILASLPFVEWPGSVLKSGLPNFIKAIVFYFFTVKLVINEESLRRFIIVFLGCMCFRVLEPLYLHITTGYWGEAAYMGGEWLDRLCGAPSDVIGANGLAFVILTVLPFLYFLSVYSKKYLIAAVLLAPPIIYALVLTESRSGMMGLMVLISLIIIKSKHKILLSLAASLALIIGFANLTPDQKDRYLSVIDSSTKNAGTAEGRVDGVVADFEVGLRRPIFGHGLGTSREANANFGEKDQLSHNLYTEIFQELGLVGLIVFLLFIKSILTNYMRARAAIRSRLANDRNKFLAAVNEALFVWLGVNFLFSFASYGLSSYEWYLFGGFTAVMKSIVINQLDEPGSNQS